MGAMSSTYWDSTRTSQSGWQQATHPPGGITATATPRFARWGSPTSTSHRDWPTAWALAKIIEIVFLPEAEAAEVIAGFALWAVQVTESGVMVGKECN